MKWRTQPLNVQLSMDESLNSRSHIRINIFQLGVTWRIAFSFNRRKNFVLFIFLIVSNTHLNHGSIDTRSSKGRLLPLTESLHLNYSLFKKYIVSSGSRQCGDPRQDVNHVIFRCALKCTRHKTKNLLTYLVQHNPSNFSDIFSHIKTPSHKLCRLLYAFFLSNNICI